MGACLGKGANPAESTSPAGTKGYSWDNRSVDLSQYRFHGLVDATEVKTSGYASRECW